jgi:hypothetical protein
LEEAQYLQAPSGDLMLLEGPANLEEGSLFDLSLAQVAEAIDASLLLVARPIDLYVDDLLSAKRRLGSRLLGVVLNDIPSDKLESVTATVRPWNKFNISPDFFVRGTVRQFLNCH